jgi:UDP-N-acetylmuramyl pentapeptide synthase
MIEPKGQGRRIAVLGRMAELGDRALELHAGLLQSVLDAKIDKIYACGKDIEALYDILPETLKGAMTDNSNQLSDIVMNDIRSGDVILVKGSFGSNMRHVVEAIKEKAA